MMTSVGMALTDVMLLGCCMTFVCAALTNVMFCASPVSTYAECWLKRRLNSLFEAAFLLGFRGSGNYGENLFRSGNKV